MKLSLPTLGIVGALLLAAPAAQAAPNAVDVSSNGTAVTVSGTPVAGANTFTFKYTGTKKRGTTGPVLVKVGAASTPDAVLAGIKAQKPMSGPEELLAATGSTILASDDEIPKGPGAKVTVSLDAGAYLVVDGVSSNPTTAFGTSFVVAPATGALTPLPKTSASITLKDYRIKAKRLNHKKSVTIVNHGPSIHFVIAISVPKGLSDKAAVKAIKRGKKSDQAKFAKSKQAELIGLVSPGTKTVVKANALSKGRWVLACFYADAASKGMEHSMLGMVTAVHVK